MCVNIIKTIYDKPTANIILNSEELKVFFLRLSMREGYPHFNTIVEVLGRAIMQKKKERKKERK